MNWNHVKTLLDGEPFAISTMNVWSYPWSDTGERINVKDPIYNQNFTFGIYEITDGHNKARFAAGEYSNNVWGIYTEN